MTSVKLDVFGEEAMLQFGAGLAHKMSGVSVIHLNGDLGMGKTTLVRGFLAGMGYSGPVKSPTYTLVEPYELTEKTVYHFDLYRLSDPEELEYMGIRDYFDDSSLSLIEWPEKGNGFLPAEDIEISIDLIPKGRVITISAISENGRQALEQFD